MTKLEVIEWMRENLDETPSDKSAFGMIMQDIGEFGFEAWLQIPSEAIVGSYIEVTEEVSMEMIKDIGNLISQEKELDELGIEQSMKIETLESISGMRDGMMDIMHSMLTYLQVRRQAQTLYVTEN